MPYQTTPPVNLAEFGLILDKPSNSTPPNAWSDSLNMRAKDDSVQGVLAFTDGFAINDNYNGAIINAKPFAVTQYTPAGASFLNIAYVIESQKTGEVGKGRVFLYQKNDDITYEITNATDDAAFTIDYKYPPQIFVFNEVLIVNPGTGVPQFMLLTDTGIGTGLQPLPGWDDAFPNRYARVMRAFGNRLVAMNFFDDAGTTSTSDDAEYPVLFAWSNPVALIGSLADNTATDPDTSGAQWQKSTVNSSGFNFLIATPGPILDGFLLGEEFIAFKSDSVVRVIPNGLDFEFQSMFEDDGILSTRCSANIGNTQQIVVGNYGIYMHDGRGDKQDLGKGLFQDSLFNSIKPADKDRTFVFHQTRDKEIWICFSSTTNTGDGCDTAYVFDYLSSKMHIRGLPNITDMFETEVNGVLEIYATQPNTKQIQTLDPDTLVSSGYIRLDNKPLGGTTTSRDVIEVHIVSKDNINFAIHGDYKPETDNPDFTDILFNPTTDYKVNVRENGKYFSFKLTMDSNKNPMLTMLSLHMRDVGRR